MRNEGESRLPRTLFNTITEQGRLDGGSVITYSTNELAKGDASPKAISFVYFTLELPLPEQLREQSSKESMVCWWVLYRSFIEREGLDHQYRPDFPTMLERRLKGNETPLELTRTSFEGKKGVREYKIRTSLRTNPCTYRSIYVRHDNITNPAVEFLHFEDRAYIQREMQNPTLNLNFSKAKGSNWISPDLTEIRKYPRQLREKL